MGHTNKITCKICGAFRNVPKTYKPRRKCFECKSLEVEITNNPSMAPSLPTSRILDQYGHEISAEENAKISIQFLEENLDFMQKQLQDHLEGRELKSTVEYTRLKKIVETLQGKNT